MQDIRGGSAGNEEVARREQRALGLTALAAVAAILWLVWPVGTGVLLGVFLAFIFRPIHLRLARRWPPTAAALATVLGSTLAIALTCGGLVWILVRDGTVLGRQAVDSLGPSGAWRKVVHAIDAATGRFGLSTAGLEAKARTLIEGASAHVAEFAQTVASTTASTLLAILFEMLTMYFVLTRWEVVVMAAQDILPLRPEYTVKLLMEFRRVGRTTLLSTGVIGLIQGVLATVGYWIAGLPEPLFFGALTAVVSLVPGLGTMLVWVPASIVLALLGHLGLGIFLALWGVLALSGVPDYLIRPRLVGKGGDQVPALLTFIALFGGAALLGLKGLIVGPVLMALAIAVLRLYADQERSRRGQPQAAESR